MKKKFYLSGLTILVLVVTSCASPFFVKSVNKQNQNRDSLSSSALQRAAGPVNLALNKNASASSEESSKGNTIANGNDGNASSRWCASNGNTGQWWQVDLGSHYDIASTYVLLEFARNIRYTISVSTDNINWSTVADNSNTSSTEQERTDNFSASARYVRITYTGLPAFTWASHYEFAVYAEESTPAGQIVNVAINKYANADSEQSSKGNLVSNGNDNNQSTRWCAADGNLNHWWRVDLGAYYDLTGSQIIWEKSGSLYQYIIVWKSIFLLFILQETQQYRHIVPVITRKQAGDNLLLIILPVM